MKEIEKLKSLIKKDNNYIPRDYKTIGGGWTVDTWKCGDVTLQVMDEGYTTRITAKELDVVFGFNGKDYVKFNMGDESKVLSLIEELESV